MIIFPNNVLWETYTENNEEIILNFMTLYSNWGSLPLFLTLSLSQPTFIGSEDTFQIVSVCPQEPGFSRLFPDTEGRYPSGIMGPVWISDPLSSGTIYSTPTFT